ncbi:hypothetical protein, conserved [Leishmania tarentolae]|uniref:Transmembrane protein n=1 Tax=Leishmania tarentolae TaxID=5689 RepID=A0A640KS86_LEITA|nr:hypothetical protein, conserved [Leishmania tarentolae]
MASHDSNGGFGSSSPGDVVKSAQAATDNVQGLLRAARKNPERELGIPVDELERRQKEACKARQFVSDSTSRKFDVKSSTRAQQIMNQGIDKYQRDKRQKDLRHNLSMLRKLQVVLCVFGAGLFGWLAVTYLLPRYVAVQDRQRRMQLRYERARKSLEGVDNDSTPVAVAVPSVGPVVRVFRVEDGDEDGVKRIIQ